MMWWVLVAIAACIASAGATIVQSSYFGSMLGKDEIVYTSLTIPQHARSVEIKCWTDTFDVIGE
jgi:hypothetical protein